MHAPARPPGPNVRRSPGPGDHQTLGSTARKDAGRNRGPGRTPGMVLVPDDDGNRAEKPTAEPG